MNALLLIDGDNLLRRFYEALDEDDPKRAEKAAGRFFSGVRVNLEAFPPTHAVIVFDFQGPKWRQALFPGYKAGRRPKPADLVRQTDRLARQIPKQLGIEVMMADGNEADDVIAAMSRSFQALPESVIRIVSTDKDFAALIDDKTEIYHPFERQIRWLDFPRQKWGVAPHQVHDLLALMGDRSDGVPGVPGIGEAKAAKLLRRYGTLAAILESPEADADADAANVCKHRDDALMSRELVGFRCDPALPEQRWDDYRLPAPASGVSPEAPPPPRAQALPQAEMSM